MEAALSSCDAALSLQADSTNAHDSRGLVLLRMGRYTEAINEYNTSLKTRPDESMSLYGRCLAKRLNGDKVAGDADVKSAVGMNAYVATAFANYGLTP